MTVRAMQIHGTAPATCSHTHLSTGRASARVLLSCQAPVSPPQLSPDGEEAIFRDSFWTIFDLLMQIFSSCINVLYISGRTSAKFGI